MTTVEHLIRFNTSMNLESENGRACVWFDEVRVDLTPGSIKIFVPSEYPEDSCEYMAVMSHEREHERVHRERLLAAVADIEQALKAAAWLPAKGNPIKTAARTAAEGALNAKLKKVLLPVHDDFKKRLQEAQAELDTPALYQWMSKRCPGWK